MKEVRRFTGCFVCGDKNLHGLQAVFLYDGIEATTTVTARADLEGYRGIYHGGILAALLDEVMIKAILALDRYAVTAEMTVRYRHPVKTGDQITFKGRITEQKGRIYFTTGEAVGEDGRVYAEATGKYLEAKPELKEELLRSLD